MKTLAQRIAANSIVMPTGCHEWQLAINNSGYGLMRNGAKIVSVHRLAYELTNGPIPAGQYVCHRCDNRKCVNAEHLFLGSATENTQDMVAKGRNVNQQKTHCKRGHEFTPENTYTYASGWRSCKACIKLHKKVN